ncbi:MAG: 23S rRNA (adenine(1618)-N(6))-methyltransferase RlmF [Methylotenera sp.]|nr:23S rRNA (adenine(1618)-N(6))-methyltransferase RlmF [Methylotenera sp.]
MIKPGLHPRNKHRSRYDFHQLIQANPALAQFVKLNAYHDASIDFSNPQAVKALNSALLKQFYSIAKWDIPAQYLCPPIPGRADYLHYLADLLAGNNDGVIPVGESVRVLDIGVGANIIYPLIGNHEYGWRFVGADIDTIALKNAQHVLYANIGKSELIELRQQTSATDIFKGIVKHDETFDLTMCNPPFHASLEDAQAGSQRKWQGLGKNTGKNFEKKGIQSQSVALNFGGQGAELYCAGGEEAFVNRMVNESQQFANQCLWFTSLISKAASLPSVYRALKKVNALEVKTIEMAQGQKKSRLVAWTFLDANQRLAWRNSHW